MLTWKQVRTGVVGLALAAAGIGRGGEPLHAQQKLVQQAGLPAAPLNAPCLTSGRGYLRARIRGAAQLDIDLHGPQVSCEGGPRFDGSGLRMGFEGRVGAGGRHPRRVRMVFGIDGVREGQSGRELPTNLTVIFEGERQLFATQGNANCTVDSLRQHALGGDSGPTRSYLVTAHGFCIAPANDLSGKRRIMVTTFDFMGRADFEHAPGNRDNPRSH